MGILRVEETGGYKLQLDLESQVLQLDIAPDDDGYKSDHKSRECESVISPTQTALSTSLVSGAMMAQKAKQFDDGLYAAVDLAAQSGAGSFRGKAVLLKTLLPKLTGLQAGSSVAGVLFGAAELGRVPIEAPAALGPFVKATVQRFQADELRSKPIGFYTWSDPLKRIFQQDRMLQSELTDKRGIETLVHALHADEEARSLYEGYLELVSQLTNPLVAEKPDLRRFLAQLDANNMHMEDGGYFFFPPSRAHETELATRLYGNRPIPEGSNLIDEFIKGIRQGSLPLEPQGRSGWYDYQTWALEPLVIPEKMPEAARLYLRDRYMKQLEELFKGILALTRETHIKQLDFPLAGGLGAGWERDQILVAPELTAEPLYSYYLRRAISYRFIRTVLERTFGDAGLRGMHRLTADGAAALNLDKELRHVSALFYGAAITVGRELGMADSPKDEADWGSGEGPDADAVTFERWAKERNDPDLTRDARMMVPVFYDRGRGKTKVWVFLGWSQRPVRVDFRNFPDVKVRDVRGQDVTDQIRIKFESRTYRLAYPVMAEVYVTKLLNRDEFRAHCDRHKTRRAILESLK
jgi:hypothetical protein